MKCVFSIKNFFFSFETKLPSKFPKLINKNPAEIFLNFDQFKEVIFFQFLLEVFKELLSDF